MANPRKITIDISKKGDTELCSLSVDIKDNTLETLIQSLEEAKKISNKHLTELVNEQKLSQKISNTRKVEETVSSDENIEESTSKKLKEDTTSISTKKDSD